MEYVLRLREYEGGAAALAEKFVLDELYAIYLVQEFDSDRAAAPDDVRIFPVEGKNEPAAGIRDRIAAQILLGTRKRSEAAFGKHDAIASGDGRSVAADASPKRCGTARGGGIGEAAGCVRAVESFGFAGGISEGEK